MPVSETIDFSKFYMIEFLEKIREIVRPQYDRKTFNQIDELVNNLKSQDDLISGLEILAREQGTSELSIFLFDILDRIYDYPPTLVYESLPEMAEDFVNTLSVMLEEVECMQAIKVTNEVFRNKDRTEEKEQEIPYEAEAEPVASAKPEKGMNFEDFFELDFYQKLQNQLVNNYEEEKAVNLLLFSKLVGESLKNKPDNSYPAELKRLWQVVQKVYPWKCGKKFNPSDHAIKSNSLLDEMLQNLAALEKEHYDLILASLESNTLKIPPKKAKAKFQPEEVGESPATIENLLSDYFQSEADEFLQNLKDSVEQLKSSAQEDLILRNLIKQFQAFKEISMIHGYSPIEDFCQEMIFLLTQVVQKKKIIEKKSLNYFDSIFNLLKKTDLLKQKDTPESTAYELQNVFNELRADIQSAREKTEKPVEPEFPSAVTEESIQQEDLITFKDKNTLRKILGELIADFTPEFKRILQEGSPQKASKTIYKILQAATLMQEVHISKFFNTFGTILNNLSESEGKQFDAQRDLLVQTYDTVATGDINELQFEDLNAQLLQILQPAKEETKISAEDVDSLVTIVAEIEKQHRNDFADSLLRVFGNTDENERKRQLTHFRQLYLNLSIAGAKNLLAFPALLIRIFDASEGYHPAENLYSEIDNSYRLFIDALENKKSAAQTEDIAQVLEEILQETLPEPQHPEVLEQSRDVAEGEESIEEIFRQEAGNYFSQIAQAISVLKKDHTGFSAMKIIEENLHALKSSARMMGLHELADQTAPLETICEKFQSLHLTPEQDDIANIETVINSLLEMVSGGTTDSENILDSLKLLQAKTARVEPEPEIEQIADSEPAHREEVKAAAEEKPFFVEVSDEDEDLLNMFKEESGQYIKIVDSASVTLRGNPTDKEALRQLEYASHSLKSAAKMLGFREIGQISDGIESIAEAVNKREIVMNEFINDQLTKAIEAIRALSSGKKLSAVEIADLIRNLDVEKIRKSQEGLSEEELKKLRVKKSAELESIHELFLREGWELLEKINHDLVILEKSPDNLVAIENLARNMHTLKGSAQMLHFEKIGTLAHRIEDFFDVLKSSGGKLPESGIDPVFAGVDEIQNLYESIKRGEKENSEDYEIVLSALNEMLGIAIQPEKSTPESTPLRPKPKIVEIEKTPVIPRESDQFIKISTERLDNLVNMAAELVINKTQLSNYLETLKKLGEKIEKDKKVLKSTNFTLEDYLEKHRYDDEAVKSKSEDHLLHSFSEDEFERFNDLHTVSRDYKEILHTIDSVSSMFNSLAQNFEQNIGRISNLTKLLHDDILQVRMVPIENLFNRFPRAVRDLAHKQNKKVNLVVEGEKTEMDRAMIESLSDPVMHLVRNAIDHGIESPDERIANGKNPDGIILLKARQDKNQIIIEVQDDGRGIDVEKVKETIVKQQLATDEEIEKFSQSELLDYIFHPGFSTRSEASHVSGRGIGLNVVTTSLQKLKGDIRVNSTPGKGVIFSLRVPLTLVISQALLIQVSGETLAIPLAPVEESVQLEPSEIAQENNKEYLILRGEKVPLIHLDSLLNYHTEEAADEEKRNKTAVIIHESGARYALIADRILRREEIVTKSLGIYMINFEFVSGGTILGDGSVVLILDTPAIARRAEMNLFGPDRDFSSIDKARKLLSEKEELKEEFARKIEGMPKVRRKKVMIDKKTITGRQPTALIVDDSISVRKFIATVMERNQYITVTANDGQEALKKLEEGNFDILITDLEMPKMHGFELIQEIRKIEKYLDMPIIILTGRAGQKHRDMGMNLGANAFLVKPFKENDLLKTLENFIAS